jgi:hypothetical protein
MKHFDSKKSGFLLPIIGLTILYKSCKFVRSLLPEKPKRYRIVENPDELGYFLEEIDE